ncbi:MAG: hypothetical protein JWR59_2509 [Brevundimonas sp.]|nr:hypothetical protein [Brevundimonas sp.]
MRSLNNPIDKLILECYELLAKIKLKKENNNEKHN